MNALVNVCPRTMPRFFGSSWMPWSQQFLFRLFSFIYKKKPSHIITYTDNLNYIILRDLYQNTIHKCTLTIYIKPAMLIWISVAPLEIWDKNVVLFFINKNRKKLNKNGKNKMKIQFILGHVHRHKKLYDGQ